MREAKGLERYLQPLCPIKEKPPVELTGGQTVDKALLLQGFAIVGTAFLI